MEEIKYIIKESDSEVISIKNLSSILYKRNLLFIAVFSFVLLGAILYTFTSKPYYDTKVSVGSAYFTGNAIEPMITFLGDLRNDNNYKSLSEKLHISDEEAHSIVKIQIRNKSTQNDFFTADIALRVSKPENIGAISQGIMQFFEENAFIKNRVSVMQKELLDFTTKGDRELIRLDSLKRSLNQVLANQQKSSANIIFPSNIHLEGVLINEKVYQARQDLKLVKGVELLSQPAVPASAANPSSVLIILAGFAAGLLAATFVVIAVEGFS